MATTNPDWLQPYAQWEWVDVTFPAAANTDCVVPHTLRVNNPNAVNYIPVRKDRAGDVYHDASLTRKAWQRDYIILRCATANARVRLLLAVEHTATQNPPSF